MRQIRKRCIELALTAKQTHNYRMPVETITSPTTGESVEVLFEVIENYDDGISACYSHHISEGKLVETMVATKGDQVVISTDKEYDRWEKKTRPAGNYIIDGPDFWYDPITD